jgi:hypothetical protein
MRNTKVCIKTYPCGCKAYVERLTQRESCVPCEACAAAHERLLQEHAERSGYGEVKCN